MGSGDGITPGVSTGRSFPRKRIPSLLFGLLIAAVSAGNLSAQDYSQETFTRGMITLSGSTTIWDGSTGSYDDEFSDISTGFPFHFYGKTYTSVRVSTNGYITFHEAGGGTLAGTDFTNDAIPSVTEPDGFIAPWWDDLEVINQGSIDRVSHLLEGTSPNRVFTVEWYSVTNYSSSGSDWHYFQVKLYEGSDIIELHYGIWSDDGTESATVGIEKIDGSGGMDATGLGEINTAEPSFNYRFTPVAGTWDGGVSSDWTDARNWVGAVPSSTTDVIIPSGTTYSPRVSTEAGSVSSLTINSNAVLEVTLSGILESGGTTVNGTFLVTGGTYNHYINASNSFQVRGTVTASSGVLNVGNPATDYYTDLAVYFGGIVDFAGAAVTICDELEVMSGGSLTISGGAVTVCAYTGANPGSQDAKFDIQSGATFTGSGGAVKVIGAYDFTTTYPAVRFSSGATVSASGTAFTLSNGQATNESFTLDLQGNGIGDLSIDKAGFSAALAGTLDCSAFLLSNGTFDTGGYSVTVSGDWTNNGSFVANGSDVNFKGTTSLSGSNALALYNATITGTLQVDSITLSISTAVSLPVGGTLRLATESSVAITPALTVDGTLDVDGGLLTLSNNLVIGGAADISGGTVTVSTIGSACTVQAGSTLSVSGGTLNLPDVLNIWGIFNLSGTGIVQNTVNAILFGDVIFQDGSGGVMTGGTLRVYNQFEAKAGTAWQATAGTVYFGGTAQSVDVLIQEPAFALYHLVVEYGVLAQIMSTSTSPLDVNGNVSIYSQGSILPNGETIEIAGNYYSEGSISGSGTITFDGASNQTIDQSDVELGSADKTATFPHLTVNKSGTLTTLVAGGSGDRLNVTGDLTILSGTLDLDPASEQITHKVGGNLAWSGGSLQIDTAGDPDTGTAHIEIAGDLSISGNASFAATSSSSAEINVGGNVTDSAGLRYHGILRLKTVANGVADLASISLSSSSAIRFLELWPQSDGSNVDRWQVTGSSTSIERVRIKRGILEIPSGGALSVADIEPDTTFNSSTAEGHIRFGLDVQPDYAKLAITGGSVSAGRFGASATSTNDGSVVVTAGTLDVNGDFLFDNTNTSGGFSPRVQFTGGAVSVAGDWILRDAEDEDALEFSASGGTITLDGSSGQSVTHQPEAEGLPAEGTYFWNLTIDNAASFSPVSVLADLTVRNLLTVSDGTIRVSGKTLTLLGAQTHSVASAGGLELEPTGSANAALVLSDGASLSVSGGFTLLRASGSVATSTVSSFSSSGSGYGITITSTGVFDANHFAITGLGSAGIVFENGATIICFHNGTLQRGSTTGSCLDFSAIANSSTNRSRVPYAFNNIVFSNAAGEGTNVRTGMNTPMVTFLGAGGSLAGEDFDEDPRESATGASAGLGGVIWRNNEIEVVETGETFHTPELALADPDTLPGHSLRPLAALFLDQELDLATWGKDVILRNFFFAPREGYAVFNSDGVPRGTLRNCTVVSGRGVDRVTAENSTFFDPGTGVLAVTNSTMTNCLYEAGSFLSGTTQAFSASAIAADFLDAAALDFHLMTASLHVDAGTDLTANWSSVSTQVTGASGVAAGATSITVESTSGFPAKGWLSLNGDAIYYNDLSAGRFEEVSGVDVTHPDGTFVYRAPTDNEGNPRPSVAGGAWDRGADESYNNGMKKVSQDMGMVSRFHYFGKTLGSLSSSKGYVVVVNAGGSTESGNNNRVTIVDLDDMSVVASQQAVGPIVNMVLWRDNTGKPTSGDYLLRVYCIVDLSGDGKGNAIQLVVYRGGTMNFHLPSGDPTSASTPVYDRRFGSDNAQGAWIFLPENGAQTYHLKWLSISRQTSDGDTNADDGTGQNPTYNSPSGTNRSRWSRIYFAAYRATGTNTGGAIFKVNADPYDVDDNNGGNNRSYGAEIWNHLPGEAGSLAYDYSSAPSFTWGGVKRWYVGVSGDMNTDSSGNPIRTGVAEVEMSGLSGSDPTVWARWGSREETLGNDTPEDYRNRFGARVDGGGADSKIVYTMDKATVVYVRKIGSQEGHEGILAAAKVDKSPTTQPVRFWNTSFLLFGVENGVEAVWLKTDTADSRNGVRVSTGQKLLPDGNGTVSPDDYESVPGTQDSEWPLSCMGSPVWTIWPAGNYLYFGTDKGLVYKYGFDRHGTKIGNAGGVNAEVLQPGYPVCIQGRITYMIKHPAGLMIGTDSGGFYLFE